MAKGKKPAYQETISALEGKKEVREKVFKRLLEHVRAGYSLNCFSELSYTSIQTYLKTYPEEFVREELDAALRDAQLLWEDIGKRQSSGQCLGNSRSWYYNMSNRYGWREKVDVKADVQAQVSVAVVSYQTKKPSQDTVEP